MTTEITQYSSESHSPAISIVVPFYNRHTLISECIGSILSQDFSRFEVVVVDDGSQPPLQRADLGKGGDDGRLKLVRQDNCGAGAARNAALKQVSGEYVLFLDSDDLLMPGALGALWAKARHGRFDAVVGGSVNFSAAGTGASYRPPHPYQDALANVVEGDWSTGSVILRRSLNLEETSRLVWEMAECYQRALSDEGATVSYVDRDIVMSRQDLPDRLTVLHDHFNPLNAGRFWCEMKASVRLNDDRRSAFDRQIFRYVVTLFHAGRHADAAELFAAADASRLTHYLWCRPLAPAWFARWFGVPLGLKLQFMLYKTRRLVWPRMVTRRTPYLTGSQV
jgi:glycosyltransferase involved in cell wall biosynthesis